MIVNLLRTGSIFTSYLSSCAIIDSKIMFDCPNGAIKAMRRKEILPVNLDVLLISNFHADHYFDIPFLLLEQGLINIREEAFYVIGPCGLEKRIDELFCMAYTESLDEIKLRSKLRIIEIQEDVKKFI